jgi:PQQ enzyme repeat
LKWKSIPIGFGLGSNLPQSSPAVVNGVVYVGSYDGNVYALKASTGAKLWSYRAGNYFVFLTRSGRWRGLYRHRRRQLQCAECQHRRPVDWPGSLLVTLGLGGVTYALIELPARAHHGGHLVAVAAVLGVAALAGFVAVEHSSRVPMVSLKLFRSRNFAGANLLTLFLYASLGGLMFFFPMDLIEIQHYTATQAKAAFLPFVAIMFWTVTLGRWPGCALWITHSAYSRASCCSLWDCVLRNGAARRELLVNIFPGGCRDGSGHDHQCCSLNYDRDERCTWYRVRACLWNQ